MKRVFVPLVLLFSLLLAACGGGAAPEAGLPTMDPVSELATKEAANPGAVMATVETVATEVGDAGISAGATAAAGIAGSVPPSASGCAEVAPAENTDKSTLQANWSEDGRIRINGMVDAAVGGAGMLTFQVNSNSQPSFWAMFLESPTTGAEVEVFSTTVSPDSPITGPLAAQNPYDPAALNCVIAVVANNAEGAATGDPFVFIQYLPVGGTAPAQLAPAQ